MFCEEKGRLLDAYGTATDRQAEAVKALSAVAAKDQSRGFQESAGASRTDPTGCGGGKTGVAPAFKNSWLLNSVSTPKRHYRTFRTLPNLDNGSAKA
jgi:hypothetical protein